MQEVGRCCCCCSVVLDVVLLYVNSELLVKLLLCDFCVCVTLASHPLTHFIVVVVGSKFPG